MSTEKSNYVKTKEWVKQTYLIDWGCACERDVYYRNQARELRRRLAEREKAHKVGKYKDMLHCPVCCDTEKLGRYCGYCGTKLDGIYRV